jgi:hypothetical protein
MVFGFWQDGRIFRVFYWGGVMKDDEWSIIIDGRRMILESWPTLHQHPDMTYTGSGLVPTTYSVAIKIQACDIEFMQACSKPTTAVITNGRSTIELYDIYGITCDGVDCEIESLRARSMPFCGVKL